MRVFERVKRFTRKKLQLTSEPAKTDFRDTTAAVLVRTRRTKDLTTFNIVLLLIVSAVVITSYISNIVKVDTLMMDITAFHKEEAQLMQTRENLRAEINMLSSYNRIQKIATEELGLIHATQQPFSLTVYGIPAPEKQSR